MRRLALLLLLLLIGCAASASGALADDAFFDGISDDGTVAVFSTKQQMVTGDTDQEPDVYARVFDSSLGEDVTKPVSTGPNGGNDTLPATYRGMSTDGRFVFFSTKERLVSDDVDQEQDVYLRDLVHNTTLLVSKGGADCVEDGCGNGDLPANLVAGGVSADGLTVYFTSQER